MPKMYFRCAVLGGAGGFASFPPNPPFTLALANVRGGHYGPAAGSSPGGPKARGVTLRSTFRWNYYIVYPGLPLQILYLTCPSSITFTFNFTSIRAQILLQLNIIS